MLPSMQLGVLTLVVVSANVLGGAMALPQALKLVRSRRVEGVSAMWAGVSASVNGWWAVYGLGTGDLGIVPVSIVSIMAYLAIGVALLRHGAGSSGRVVGIMVASGTAIAIVPALALAAGGWATAGVVLGALYGVQLSPAVVAVYRASDVSGVSAATWCLAFAEATLWGVYGVARLDPGLATLATTGMVMSALVLTRLFLRRPRRQRGSDQLGLGLAPAGA